MKEKNTETTYLDFMKHVYTGDMCEEYKNEITKCHEDRLLLAKLAMRQQSIPYMATTMSSKIVSVGAMRRFFKDYINGCVLENCDGVDGYKYAWYIDYNYDNDIIANEDVIHITHTIGSTIIIPQHKCPTLYISNGSKVHISCDGFNSVRLYLFDKAQATIDDVDEESDITVYKYSDKCKVTKGKYALGKVNEFEKELKL